MQLCLRWGASAKEVGAVGQVDSCTEAGPTVDPNFLLSKSPLPQFECPYFTFPDVFFLFLSFCPSPTPPHKHLHE